MSHAPETLQPADMWRDHAACSSPFIDPEEMFPSPAPGEILHAKTICHGCPVLTDCGTWALDTGVEYGVWGGMSEGERRSVRRRRAERQRVALGLPKPSPGGYRKPAPCGTTAAYSRHIRYGEVVDDECKAAFEADRAEREAARIEAAKCGTRNGHRKHERNSETPCTPCAKANADADRRLQSTGTKKAKVSA